MEIAHGIRNISSQVHEPAVALPPTTTTFVSTLEVTHTGVIVDLDVPLRVDMGPGALAVQVRGQSLSPPFPFPSFPPFPQTV